ncbi:MAG: hypothetical protein PVH30_09175 [Desulfobacterales bacterium]
MAGMKALTAASGPGISL